MLLKHLTQLPISNERLLENLRVTRGPSLPSVLEVGSSEGVWIVVEGAEGESLRWVMSTLARASGFIAPNEGLAVVARAAAGLSALHQQQLVHGDVCPATIFLTDRGEVQLHDAGIAAALNLQAELGPCRSELNSLAPEQINGPATAHSDVFRLGLVLYELSVGRPLWSGNSPAQISQAASTWQGLTREKVKQVPEPCLTLLVTMLAADPAARPSMEEVVAVLEQAVTQNDWATTDDDIARLFARAAQGRPSPFALGAGAEELCLDPLTPPAGAPAATPPGAVVARITTKKMTREMLAVVRTAIAEVADASLEVRAANLLIDQGRLTRAQLTAAQETVTARGGELHSILIDDGAVDEDALVAAVGELTRTPSVNLKKLADAAPSAEALALLPLALSRATQAVPLGLKGGSQLMVAMADPMDARALEQLKAAIGARRLIAFRAGSRALSIARARLYVGTPTPLTALELSAKITDTLLGQHGLNGMHAQQLVNLTMGLAKRLGLSWAEVTLAGLVSRAMVTAAIISGNPPSRVPKLAAILESIGSSEADDFVEALHAFPARVPERPLLRAVVVAFAFAEHAGEPRPSGSRLGGALTSFRTRHQLPPALLEALAAELSQ